MREKKIAEKIYYKIVAITQSLIDNKKLTKRSCRELTFILMKEIRKHPRKMGERILAHLWDMSHVRPTRK